MTTGGTVLIADDDADVLRAARVALGPVAERIETALEAGALPTLLGSSAFDAVLLDMNFVAGARSGRDGLEALAQLQAMDPTLAIVLMTAYGGVTLAVEGLKRGAADFILKPWRNDKLVAAVEAAISLTRQRRQAETLKLDELERRAVERALTHHDGNVSLAASTLGISRPALYRRMQKYGL